MNVTAKQAQAPCTLDSVAGPEVPSSRKVGRGKGSSQLCLVGPDLLWVPDPARERMATQACGPGHSAEQSRLPSSWPLRHTPCPLVEAGGLEEEWAGKHRTAGFRPCFVLSRTGERAVSPSLGG